MSVLAIAFIAKENFRSPRQAKICKLQLQQALQDFISPDQAYQLRIQSPKAWHIAAATANELFRKGIAICTPKEFSFLFRPALNCSPEISNKQYRVINIGESKKISLPENAKFFTIGRYTVWKID